MPSIDSIGAKQRQLPGTQHLLLVDHKRNYHHSDFIINTDGLSVPMTGKNPRAGWEKIGDQFYQKVQLYEAIFDPDLELGNYLVAGAPYGGAIGMLSATPRWNQSSCN